MQSLRGHYRQKTTQLLRSFLILKFHLVFIGTSGTASQKNYIADYIYLSEMLTKVIKAVQNLDIPSLQKLLDNNKTYMDMSKQLFLEKLDRVFLSIKEDGCNKFEDHYFGICSGCYKGCEVRTFITSNGHHLNLIFESKDQSAVDDIYLCHNVENFTDLNNVRQLNFDFYEDEKADFVPTDFYSTIVDGGNSLIYNMGKFHGQCTLQQFINFFEKFKDLELAVDKITIYDDALYKNYYPVQNLIRECKRIIDIKHHSEEAINALIDFHLATDERSQVEWVFKNRKRHCLASVLNILQNFPIDSKILVQLGNCDLTIDIVGFEHVVEFYQKLDKTYYEIMMRYEPLPEQLARDRSISFSLDSYLNFHGKYQDLLDEYFPEYKDITDADDEVPF